MWKKIYEAKPFTINPDIANFFTENHIRVEEKFLAFDNFITECKKITVENKLKFIPPTTLEFKPFYIDSSGNEIIHQTKTYLQAKDGVWEDLPEDVKVIIKKNIETMSEFKRVYTCFPTKSKSFHLECKLFSNGSIARIHIQCLSVKLQSYLD